VDKKDPSRRMLSEIQRLGGTISYPLLRV